MPSNTVMGHLYAAWKSAVDQHDAANPDHQVLAIGMSHFDIERLGLEEGEPAIPSRSIVLQNDGGPTGNFRVICDGQHDSSSESSEAAKQPVRAVSGETYTRRTDPVYA